MRVDRVSVTVLEKVPITPPPFRKNPSSASHSIIEIATDTGITGYGVTRAGGDYLTKQIAPMLIGKDPLLTEEIWNQLYTRFGGRNSGGHAAELAGVDLALWDIRGKASGLPVWRLLGGAQDRVHAYVSFGVAGPNTSAGGERYGLEELANEAKFLVKQGHNKLKTAVGRDDPPNPEEDYRRMAAIREAVGPDAKLMMDASCKMTFQDALRLCDLCKPLNITFFEEPVLHNDPRLLGELRRRTSVPIASNPVGYRWAYRELLMHDGADFIQPNVTQIGLTESWKIAEMARAFNRQIANGNGGGPHNAHLQVGMANGWGVEFHYHNWMMYQAVYQDVPGPRDGWLTLSEKPGFGLEPKPEVLKEFARPR